VMLIYNGEVSVAINGNIVAKLRDGSFIGEMSYITGNLPSATVMTTVNSRLIAFPKVEIRNLMARNPGMQSTFHAILSADLSKKLAPQDDTEKTGLFTKFRKQKEKLGVRS
jgi:CRP-like cAMP-binding protein